MIRSTGTISEKLIMGAVIAVVVGVTMVLSVVSVFFWRKEREHTKNQP